MQVSVLQTLADEKCLHLMPPMDLAILKPSAYRRGLTVEEHISTQHAESSHQKLQHILHEIQQSSLLDKCRATGSLIKDL